MYKLYLFIILGFVHGKPHHDPNQREMHHHHRQHHHIKHEDRADANAQAGIANGAASSVLGVGTTLFNGIPVLANGLLNTTGQVLQGAGGALGSLTNVVPVAFTGISNAAGQAVGTVAGTANGLTNGISNALQSLLKGANGVVAGFGNQLVQVPNTLFSLFNLPQWG